LARPTTATLQHRGSNRNLRAATPCEEGEEVVAVMGEDEEDKEFEVRVEEDLEVQGEDISTAVQRRR
jgi:hypothetical protein